MMLKQHIKYVFLIFTIGHCLIGANVFAIECEPSYKYYQAREAGKGAYAEMSNRDLQEILIENYPNINRFGSCAELINIGTKIVGIFNPSYYINYSGILAVLEYIADQVVKGICREILEEARDDYGIIADVIGDGDYIIVVDGVLNAGVSL